MRHQVTPSAKTRITIFFLLLLHFWIVFSGTGHSVFRWLLAISTLVNCYLLSFISSLYLFPAPQCTSFPGYFPVQSSIHIFGCHRFSSLMSGLLNFKLGTFWSLLFSKLNIGIFSPWSLVLFCEFLSSLKLKFPLEMLNNFCFHV